MPPSSQTAAEAAALGAWRSLSVGDRAGGVLFNDEEVVEVMVNEDGTVSVTSGNPDIGGSRASLALMAAEELGTDNFRFQPVGPTEIWIAGIDPDKVGRAALKKGVINEEQLRLMTDQEKVALILLPGFSTAEKVTDVSGRGVGMDVVKRSIEALRGRIDHAGSAAGDQPIDDTS